MQTSISKLGIIESLTKFKEDSLDTMNKVGKFLPFLLEVSSASINDELDFDTVYDFTTNTPVQFLMNDGDIIQLMMDSSNNVVAAIQDSTSGTVVDTTTIVTRSGSHYYLSSTDCPAINGDNWTLDEIFDSQTQTYSTNDLVSRACQLAEDGNLNPANFVSSCSDISGQLYGDCRDMYNLILQNVGNNNVAGLAVVLSRNADALKNSTIGDNTIDFVENDYYVHSYVGTAIINGLTVAVQVLGIVLSALGFGIGLAVTLVGTAASSLFNMLQQKTSGDATINKEAYDYSYQQPIYQGRLEHFNKQGSFADADNLFDFLYTNRMLRVNGAGTVYYLWVNDSDIHSDADIDVNIEVFANINVEARMTPDEAPTGGMYTPPAFTVQTNDPNLRIQSYIPSGGDSNLNQWFESSKVQDCLEAVDQSDNFTDDQILRRVWIGVMETIAFSTFTNNVDFTVTQNSNLDISYATTCEKLVGLMVNRMYRQTWSWSLLVNDIIPKFQSILDSQTPSFLIPITNKIRMLIRIAYMMKLVSYDAEKHVNVLSSSTMFNITSTFPSKGVGYVIPPNYTKSAFWISVAIGVLAATAAIALYFVGKIAVRRITAKIMFKKYARVQSLQAAAISDPTTENVNAYLKSIRKYNIVARVLGQSTLNPISGWISEVDTASTSDTLLSILNGKSEDNNNEKFDAIINILKPNLH